MDTYKAGTTYIPGSVVLHDGKAYQKLDDGDNSPPDDVPGGWKLIPDDRSNLTEYQAIEASLGSYEQRVKDHKAEVLAKLAAEGLDPSDVKAVLNAAKASG